MVRTTIFHSNRSQAVRLPKDVAFPDDVKQVTVLREGKRRVIVPAWVPSGMSFSTRPAVDLGPREQPPAQAREVCDAALPVGHESLHPRAAGPPDDVA